MFWILVLYFDFEVAKNIHVLHVPIWGFWGCWRFLTGVWHLYLDLDMAISVWYNPDPNFGSLSWFWRCKEHLCPLSPALWLWRMLEVPDWSLAFWAWFEKGHWSLIHPCLEFQITILNMKMQRTSMSFKSWFGDFEDAGGSWSGFGILIMIWICSLVFDTTMIWILALYLELKVQRTLMSFQSSFGALEDADGSWLGFCILILILILSVLFVTPIFSFLALYLDFEDAKNIYVL